MALTRQTLHDLVDIVDPSEFDIIYRLLVKFIPEDDALPDEIEAMRLAETEIANGETIPYDDVDWK